MVVANANPRVYALLTQRLVQFHGETPCGVAGLGPYISHISATPAVTIAHEQAVLGKKRKRLIAIFRCYWYIFN